MTEQQIDLRERELDYWMARAYEAEGKLWKAEARVRAVRDALDRAEAENPPMTLGSHRLSSVVHVDAIRRALDGHA